MALNPGRRNRKLPDKSMDRVGPLYPDPIEGEEVRDTIAVPHPSGVEYHERVWREARTVWQFAVVLVVDDDTLEERPAEVTRADTWHSTVHRHQFYASGKSEEPTVIHELYGGDRMQESKRVVHDQYKRFSMEFTYNAIEYLECWEDRQDEEAINC